MAAYIPPSTINLLSHLTCKGSHRRVIVTCTIVQATAQLYCPTPTHSRKKTIENLSFFLCFFSPSWTNEHVQAYPHANAYLILNFKSVFIYFKLIFLVFKIILIY
jgi:hypothetical protein